MHSHGGRPGPPEIPQVGRPEWARGAIGDRATGPRRALFSAAGGSGAPSRGGRRGGPDPAPRAHSGLPAPGSPESPSFSSGFEELAHPVFNNHDPSLIGPFLRGVRNQEAVVLRRDIEAWRPAED